MLSKILKGNIAIKKEVSDWEESIKIASEPLVKKGKIEKRYIEAIINDIKKLGFYVVITDKVAMPHSRPENGVIETSLSLLKLDKFIKYGEYEVNLIFILAGRNKVEHIEILRELSDFLDEEKKVEEIVDAHSVEEIEKIIKNRR